MKKFLILFLAGMILNLHSICFAQAISDDIQVTLTQIPLSSKLKKQYNGYQYTIANTSNQNFNLVNAQIVNAVNGSVAHQSVTDGHPIGTTWAICGPAGLLTFGIGWITGIIATPIVWIVSSNSGKKAQNEAIAYPNIVNLGYLNKGEMINAKVLVPIGTQPQLKMTLQSEKSKELIMINK